MVRVMPSDGVMLCVKVCRCAIERPVVCVYVCHACSCDGVRDDVRWRVMAGVSVMVYVSH